MMRARCSTLSRAFAAAAILGFVWLGPLPRAGADDPGVAKPVEPTTPQDGTDEKTPEAMPAPEAAPAIQRLLEEPYLTDAERRALRIRHGLWTPEDLADATDPDSAARAALIRGSFDDQIFSNEHVNAALRARATFERGEYEAAMAIVLPLTPDAGTGSLSMFLLKAECLEALGSRAEADAALDPLVARMAELSQAETWTDADEIADGVRGLMLRARLRGPEKSDGGDFKAMMATLSRAREQVDKLNWSVALAEAELLVDKDNYSDAAEALSTALTLNPMLAQAWAMVGQLSAGSFDFQRAESVANRLELNATGSMSPGTELRSVDAALVLSRTRLRQSDAAGAIAILEPLLARFPGHRELLAARAAASAVAFDFDDVDRRLKEFDVMSPRSPLAYLAVGRVLSEARQYEEAARYLEEAARRAPNWPTPAIELGLLEVQSGRNDKALTALEAAAKLDSFNVRAANSLKLIRDLREFSSVESDHFIVRYKGPQDEVLAREMPAALERIYARVTGTGPGGIRHEPRNKTVIELMPDHHWFSVRITGMPRVHTIAAATGPLVAMEAPRSGPGHLVGPYDWARVIQHEYTHTVTLSRTKNRLPHWFTEAAAVYLEDAPRDWSTVSLLAQALENDELFSMDDINVGFVRPKKPSDRQLAYAQGHWMYEYIVTRFGAEAPLKLMDAYARGVKEDEAFQTILGVQRGAFLNEFKAWAGEQLVAWGMKLPEGTPDVSTLLEAHNAEATAKGLATVEEPTIELVDEWLKVHPSHPDLLKLAVTLRLDANSGAANAALVPYLERYASSRPPDPMPHKLLARYYLDASVEERANAIPHLAFLDAREQHTPSFAMELSRLHASRGNWDDAAKYAERAATIAPYDAGVREFAATMALRHSDRSTAERHIRALVALEPDREIHKQRLEALLKMN